MVVDVEILDFNETDMINKVALACYTCTHSDLSKFVDLTLDEKKQLIKRVVSRGHLSVLRHANFTIAIIGGSRAMTHQLVRHQAGFNFSQQSLRYTKINEENDDFYNLPEILKKSRYSKNIENVLHEIKSLYIELINDGIKAEDARYILPIGTKSNIIVTANGESLYNLFKSRCCSRAQLEIRKITQTIQKYMEENFPYMFFNTGPDCKNCKEKCK